MKSEIAGFYKLSIEERRNKIAEITGIVADEEGGFSESLNVEMADQMVENVVGVMGVPLGICTYLRVNGKDRLVPMAIEESSVIAAASNAAKLLRGGKGIIAETTKPIMIGQIQLMDVPDMELARSVILEAKEELLQQGATYTKLLVELGGGPVDIEVRELPSFGGDDPLGSMLIVHILVDVRDAMGANTVNTICEGLSSRLVELSGGRARLRILSNLADKRLVTVKGKVPFEAFCKKGQSLSFGEETAKGIEEASVFAERDPYRAATHNKGIMNGIDAVLMATGQDYRAVEAGVHAYASRSGRYTSLSKWRVQEGFLYGELSVPMALGIVGGITRIHPTVKQSFNILNLQYAHELAEITASVGLAQNLAALRALAMEGIQQGHMRLHARNIAIEAGASGELITIISEKMIASKQVNHEKARELLNK